MDIKFHFSLTEQQLQKYVYPDIVRSSFSLKQKVYYNLVRPVLPVAFRQKLQKAVSGNISFRENFIDDSLVEEIIRGGFVQKSGLYPGGKDSAFVLTHDVEEQAGFDYIPKIIELEKKYGFVSSWNIVPYKYKIDTGIINLIKDAGDEVGIHGYNHDGKLYKSRRIFDERVLFINEALQKYGAVGFRSPLVHRNLRWLQKLDIEYDESCFDYDPFQTFPGGTGSIWPFMAGKFMELPYTLPQDHVLFYILQVVEPSIWIVKTDWLIKNHGVVLMLTHPDYLKDARQLLCYEEYLKYMHERADYWHGLPRELASNWKKIIND